jgi:hypothetical protein
MSLKGFSIFLLDPFLYVVFDVPCYSKHKIIIVSPGLVFSFLASRLAHNHLPGIVIYLLYTTACISFI